MWWCVICRWLWETTTRPGSIVSTSVLPSIIMAWQTSTLSWSERVSSAVLLDVIKLGITFSLLMEKIRCMSTVLLILFSCTPNHLLAVVTLKWLLRCASVYKSQRNIFSFYAVVWDGWGWASSPWIRIDDILKWCNKKLRHAAMLTGGRIV